MPAHNLASLVHLAAERSPAGLAVVGPDAELSYGELDAQASALAAALARRGVTKGERVCIWLPKSTRSIVAMQAVLRLGAVYVPIDPDSPSERARKIIVDCRARCLIMREDRPAPLPAEADTGSDAPVLIGSQHARATSFTAALSEQAPPLPAFAPVDPEELAYILYTSGSTGTPKGVCVSHRAALAFVHWAVELLDLRPTDRLASHAPFHFDLSVLDLYGAFARGARVCLIPEGLAYAPAKLVDFIREHHISCWYSVPSVLMLMMDRGALLELDSPPRHIVFAGEPFPLKHLRALRERFTAARMFNFYGPTETNVCTYYEVESIDPERHTPVPIGAPCCGDRGWVRKRDGAAADVGEEGELIIAGPTVMSGYWGRPALARGEPDYATGDIVRVLPGEIYEYVGRRDHMVKVRGMRIEIGEIEAALLEHPAIEHAAVVVAGSGLEARLVAFLVTLERLSIIKLKRHCAERLPRYMVIDRARPLDALPRTPNGKIDRRLLCQYASEGSS